MRLSSAGFSERSSAGGSRGGETTCKGEWKYDASIGVIESDGTSIALILDGVDENGAFSPEGQANARLIAAAPDMYQLLQALVEADNCVDIGEVYLDAKELLERIDGTEGQDA